MAARTHLRGVGGRLRQHIRDEKEPVGRMKGSGPEVKLSKTRERQSSSKKRND